MEREVVISDDGGVVEILVVEGVTDESVPPRVDRVHVTDVLLVKAVKLFLRRTVVRASTENGDGFFKDRFDFNNANMSVGQASSGAALGLDASSAIITMRVTHIYASQVDPSSRWTI
jgi:hypothetical protein